MNRDSLAKMRLDRRLLARRGWIRKAELEAALTDLPDAADKAITLGQADGSNDDAEESPSQGV